ncbi:hypothetical protein KP509_31G061100 [Ceratopteris richardii]|uniref:Calcium uniporter protein C-terminal domain-containing protein n=1 Tax=Ceratopteris richardii TaxID=49495 RepID=A0A8T2QZU2_CERRI|nr:hypothetical protein KP509_31G061100 [Ceratopteris richardii]
MRRLGIGASQDALAPAFADSSYFSVFSLKWPLSKPFSALHLRGSSQCSESLEKITNRTDPEAAATAPAGHIRSMLWPPIPVATTPPPPPPFRIPLGRQSSSTFSVTSLKSQIETSWQTGQPIELLEIKRILHLDYIRTMKAKLQKGGRDVLPYNDLLKICTDMGLTSSSEDAAELLKSLQDSFLILKYQDIVYLNPQKLIQLINDAVPRPSTATLTGKDNASEEIKKFQEEKDVIDTLSSKYSRKVLWIGFVFLTLQMLAIFRLTFWELSWNVMEPIAYFTANITLLIGYFFFMINSKNPTYGNVDAVLTSSRRRKLMKHRIFDMEKLLELERRYATAALQLRSTTHS